MRQLPILLSMTLCAMTAMNTASADMIRGIDIDFVPIGDAGNPADSTGFGAVGYEYRIGTYEVTNAQWDAFVSLSGGPTGNPSYGYDEPADRTGSHIPTDRVSNRGNPPALPGDSQSLTDTGVVFRCGELGTG